MSDINSETEELGRVMSLILKNPAEDFKIILKKTNSSRIELLDFLRSYEPKTSQERAELRLLISDVEREKKHKKGLIKIGKFRHDKAASIYLSSFARNRSDLVKKMAEDAQISEENARKALDSLLKNISNSLRKGERVSLVGFGSWSVSKRNERQGRNPATGQIIKIAAKNVIKFQPGSDLNESVN